MTNSKKAAAAVSHAAVPPSWGFADSGCGLGSLAALSWSEGLVGRDISIVIQLKSRKSRYLCLPAGRLYRPSQRIRLFCTYAPVSYEHENVWRRSESKSTDDTLSSHLLPVRKR